MICITKDTLRQLNAAVGKLDLDTNQVVVGFVGRLEMSDGLYHGDMLYSAIGDEPPKDTVSVKAILGAKSPSTKTPSKPNPKLPNKHGDIGDIADGDPHD